VLDEALGAPETDWLIRSETSIDEALDIELTGGWVSLISPHSFCTIVDQELL
jgi:hypothetical protein